MSLESSTQRTTAAPAAEDHRADRPSQTAATAAEAAQAAGFGRLGLAVGVVTVSPCSAPVDRLLICE